MLLGGSVSQLEASWDGEAEEVAVCVQRDCDLLLQGGTGGMD